MKMRRALAILVLGLSIVVSGQLPKSALAAFSGWQESPHVRVQLVSELDRVSRGSEFDVGFRFEMEQGWHLYWKNPGDTGLPTKVDWVNSPGLTFAQPDWPTPRRFNVSSLVNYGYEDTLLIPIKAKLQKNSPLSRSITLKANLSWLICKEECIPGQAVLSLSLPISKISKVDREATSLLRTARSELPRLYGAGLRVYREGGTWRLDLPPEFAVEGAYFFSGRPDLVEPGQPQKVDNRHLVLPLAKSFKQLSPVWDGVLTNTIGEAWQVNLVPYLTSDAEKIKSWWHFDAQDLLIVFYAFLGGLLLNLMPCVFPVLAFKALGLMKAAQKSRRARINHALAYLMGVLTSLWILSALVLLIRFSGSYVGWGFQLQSPLFVALLCTLLWAFSLNLLDLFTISGRFTGWGQSWVELEGQLGVFFSGVLTVLVATPCTAPFMASAMGLALLQPGIISVVIFTSLGLGLASPYVTLVMMPKWQKYLPRPGLWMSRVKQLLALPMLLTLVWLLWVFWRLTSFSALGALSIALLMIGAWLVLRRLPKSTLISFVSSIAIGVFLVSATYVYKQGRSFGEVPKERNLETEEGWEAYSDILLQRYLVEGRAIFLDFTADWCLTCKVNEKVALSSQEVKDFFVRKNVVLLRADWTSYDPAITAVLKGFGRAGVPLYVYYPGNSRKPVILPQLLTPGIVLERLKEK